MNGQQRHDARLAWAKDNLLLLLKWSDTAIVMRLRTLKLLHAGPGAKTNEQTLYVKKLRLEALDNWIQNQPTNPK